MTNLWQYDMSVSILEVRKSQKGLPLEKKNTQIHENRKT